MSTWYTNAITGEPIYTMISADGLRHFTLQNPMKGVLALCGDIVNDFIADALTTCPRCADIVCDIKLYTPPPPPPTDAELAAQAQVASDAKKAQIDSLQALLDSLRNS